MYIKLTLSSDRILQDYSREQKGRESISVNSGTTVNVLIDAKMLVSKMRPKTVQNFKGCKDARIQDAKIYGRKLSCLEYKLSAVESRGDTAIPFHAGFLLN